MKWKEMQEKATPTINRTCFKSSKKLSPVCFPANNKKERKNPNPIFHKGGSKKGVRNSQLEEVNGTMPPKSAIPIQKSGGIPSTQFSGGGGLFLSAIPGKELWLVRGGFR